MDIVRHRAKDSADIAIGGEHDVVKYAAVGMRFDRSALSFDLVILASAELRAYSVLAKMTEKTTTVLKFVPLPKGAFDDEVRKKVLDAVTMAIGCFEQGRRVLIACADKDRSRSAFLASLAIHAMDGCGGPQALEIVTRARGGKPTMGEPYVRRFLENVAPSRPQGILLVGA